MEQKINPNDSIYPSKEMRVTPVEVDGLVDNYTTYKQISGLTKREYFSAMAMQSYINQYPRVGPDEIVRFSTTVADALINELNK